LVLPIHWLQSAFRFPQIIHSACPVKLENFSRFVANSLLLRRRFRFFRDNLPLNAAGFMYPKFDVCRSLGEKNV